MNPLHLTATELLVWGGVIHLVADWPLQSDWMAREKSSLLHPAGYVHAGIHGALFVVIFGWVAIPIAISHLLIDTRKPVEWWTQMMKQKQPVPTQALVGDGRSKPNIATLIDMGLWVKLMMDQAFHIIIVAIAALAVTL